jgi:hypothetical protein
MVFIKRVNNSDAGDATHWGGDHFDNLDKMWDDTDIESITGKPARIKTKVEFRDGKLYIWNGSDTFAYRLKAGTISSNVDVTLPSLAANGTLVAAGGANDWGTAVQTFRSSNLEIKNPANSNSYIFVTSAITGSRNITIPLLTADDSFLFTNHAQTPINKTLNIDTNTFKHSTTNAQGDIYKYDTTVGKIVRIPRGSANQLLKVKSDGSDLEWASESGSVTADKVKVYEGGTLVGTVARKLNFNASDFICAEDVGNDEIDVSLTSPGGGGGSADELYSNLVPNGNKYGYWVGESDIIGSGLFGNISRFDVTSTSYFDTTNGYTGQNWVISGSNAVGWKTNNLITMRKLNPDITFSFQLDEGGDNTGVRFYCGFASTNAVTENSSFLDSLSGIVMFKNSGDNFFKIAHNDGSGTMVEDSSILVTDSLIHRIRIVGDEANTRFSYQLDGGTLTHVATDIPSSTAQLAVVFNASTNDATTRNLRGFWAKMKHKERT